jgi:hypothetical protein
MCTNSTFTYKWLVYCCKIKEILFKYGLNYVWLNQCVDNVENLLLKLKERIIGSFISEVTAFLENSPKWDKKRYSSSIEFLLQLKQNLSFLLML